MQEQEYMEAYAAQQQQQQMENGGAMEDPMEDPDYYEYDPDQVAAAQQYQ